MTKKIVIRYNQILDEMAKAHAALAPKTSKTAELAAQKTDIVLVEEKIKEYRKLWDSIGNDKIFATIEQMTGKTFLNRCVVVNIVWVCRITEAYGMVIPITHDPDNFVITLTHELMHLSGGVFTPEFNEKYKNETLDARVHIVVNAMTEYLWRDVLGKPEYVARHKERCRNNNAKDHIRAWEIIEEVGYKYIVDNYLAK